MTFNDPNSPYEPPRDTNTGLWMALAVIVLLVLGGAVYVLSSHSDQTAANLPSPPTTTGQGASRVAEPPPAPVK
jgi:hypothetical protein